MTAKQARTPTASPASQPQAKAIADIFAPTTTALNVKQSKKRASKARQNSLKMRAHLWPGVGDSALWLREDDTRKGFTTMPRTMPAFVNLIQDVSKRVSNGKSIPAGKSYLVLWCRVFDEGFLRIDQEAAAALEAGYSGERNITTWREHLRVLKDLGFIDYKPGPAGPCQFVLLLNPYQAVKMLRSRGWVQEEAYTALLQRALEIGATDLDEV